MDFLLIGDPHAQRGVTNERFEAVANFAVDRQPDTILCVGDFGDFPSLSSYDKGKKSHEGRRYSLDLDAVHDALSRFQDPFLNFNKTAKARKVKQYTPTCYMLGGNHDEGRIKKAVEANSELDGTLSIDDCQYEEFGWNFSPFRALLEVEGITFSHYFSNAMERSISGENLGRTLNNKKKSSSICGHTHKLDLAWDTNIKGQKMVSGSIGCFFNHKMDWASKESQDAWWRGIILLKGVSNGVVGDMELITLDTLLKEYL